MVSMTPQYLPVFSGIARPVAARFRRFAAFLPFWNGRGVRFSIWNEFHGRPKSTGEFWIASIWFGFALFDATQTVFVMHAEGMHHAWVRLFATTMLAWLPWALATPLVVRLGRRYPPVN